MEIVSESEYMKFASKLVMGTFLTTLHAKPFLSLNVQQIIWGYNDSICNEEMKCEKFGILRYVNINRQKCHKKFNSIILENRNIGRRNYRPYRQE